MSPVGLQETSSIAGQRIEICRSLALIFGVKAARHPAFVFLHGKAPCQADRTYLSFASKTGTGHYWGPSEAQKCCPDLADTQPRLCGLRAFRMGFLSIFEFGSWTSCSIRSSPGCNTFQVRARVSVLVRRQPRASVVLAARMFRLLAVMQT